MASIITLTGIDQALSNLDYRNKNSLKYRVVHSIRDFYADETSIESIKEIETDKLIKLLWDTGDDPTKIKKKRRNFSSIKSSINSDLKRLYQVEKNLEGLTIGPANIFDVSDEAKEEILKNFTYGAKGETVFTMSQIMEVLKVVNDILSKPEEIADEGGADALGKLDQLRDLIQGLSEKIGLEGPEQPQKTTETAGDAVGSGDIEEAEVEEDLEDVEVFEEPDEVEEVIEGVDPDEEIEPGDFEEVEEVEDSDEEEVVEDLEDDEVDEAIDEAEVEEDLEEAEVEEDVEEAKVEGDLEDIEVVEEPEEVDEVIEEIDPEEEIEEIDEDDILEDIGEGYSDGGYEEGGEIEKARLLAEEFNNYLGAIDKFYNHYLLIPEGEYIVGNKHHKKNEKPEQKVHLSPFYIGKFPVTNALFEIFVEKTGYRTTAERVGYGTVYYGRYQKRVDKQTGLETLTWNSALVNKTVEGACWYQPLGPGSTLHGKRNHPVVQVSIEDAMAFAAWTGKRLPTEDEWEAASRTAKGCRFPWGNEWRENSCNIEKSHIGDTTPVDKYIGFANDFGIVDILGNVLEWTQDSSNPHSDGKNRSRYHIVKGGNWTSGNDIRLPSRFKLESESYANILGFRCVAY